MWTYLHKCLYDDEFANNQSKIGKTIVLYIIYLLVWTSILTKGNDSSKQLCCNTNMWNTWTRIRVRFNKAFVSSLNIGRGEVFIPKDLFKLVYIVYTRVVYTVFSYWHRNRLIFLRF